MTNYEIMFIVRPNLENESTKKVAEEMKKVLEAKGATVNEEKDFGKKELAYSVKGFNNGNYFLFNVTCKDSEAIKEFDRVALISENVIKHLIVKL
jgi:small subunit ribosomal protein S6